MRTCGMCKRELDESMFFAAKSNPSGLQGRCKECTKAAASLWRKQNPQRAKEISRASAKRSRSANPEKHNTPERRAYSAEWRQNNPERFAELCKRRSKDLLDCYVRSVLAADGLPRCAITDDLLHAKRVQLQIKRHLKEATK